MTNFVSDDLILWMDEALIVVNKPAGLLSLPDGYKQLTPHLQSILEPRYGKLWIVHRLDKDTSGVIVLARSAAVHHQLNDQFAARIVQKTYHALVWGNPDWEERSIAAPLRKNGDRSHRTVIDPEHGKPASTAVRVLERFPSASLIQARPHTGYTHQIRAHLAWVGYPLLADPLYRKMHETADLGQPEQKAASAPMETALPMQRLALHALEITFHHPVTAAEMTFSAPYPDDFSSALRALREPGG
jgi:tRNA pseudouridine32 synthase / 23S rRNA pseudouridine746 synthase